MNNMDLSYEFYDREYYRIHGSEERERCLVIEASWTDNDGYTSKARTCIPLQELKDELARIP